LRERRSRRDRRAPGGRAARRTDRRNRGGRLVSRLPQRRVRPRRDALSGGESGAEAIAASSVALVASDAFDRIASDDPLLYLAVARNIAHRTAQVQAKLERQSRAPAEARVAAALLEICDDFGIPLATGGHRIDLPISQEDLARLAGTTRETASTAVASFARRGLIRGSRLKGLALVDAAGLAATAETYV
jgi:CRP/FNR family cyclic AMP-dependent transcriptional regulator